MSIKHDLKHSILNILKHNRDGSKNTQAARKKRLMMIADQLIDRGYQLRNINMLKPKHIQYLTDRWLSQGLNAGTIKNRMTDLRWLAEKLNIRNLTPSDNNSLNIPQRKYVTNTDKSIILSEGDLSKIIDPNVKLSLLLQKAFGLRREESIKIRINQAVVGNQLHLQGSWCKNGRPRIININYPEQHSIIERCKAHLGTSKRSLIPKGKTYYQQLKKYENELAKAGINKAHGLRHAYAQKRYFDLTGWDCPAKGGPTRKQLNSAQKQLDQTAREIISKELGHNRTITSIYCGQY